MFEKLLKKITGFKDQPEVNDIRISQTPKDVLSDNSDVSTQQQISDTEVQYENKKILSMNAKEAQAKVMLEQDEFLKNLFNKNDD